MKCTKTEIYDPFTKRCLKLQMKGTLYKRYIVPFLLGDDSFLNAFSARDQRKFVMFLKREGVFVHHPYVQVRNTRERIPREERRLSREEQEEHRQKRIQTWTHLTRNQRLLTVKKAADKLQRDRRKQGRQEQQKLANNWIDIKKKIVKKNRLQ